MLNKIFYNGATLIEGNHIFGGCNYTHILNNGDDWQPGVAACAELIFTSDNVLQVGRSLIWDCKMEGASSYTTIGIFTIKSRKRVKDKYTYTCYDNMMLLEEYDISSTWEGLWGTNKTLLQIYNAICTAVGVTAGSASFTNSSYTIDKKRFNCNNVTARQLLSYIASIAGGYAYADNNGYIKIANLGTTSQHTFTNTEYKSVEVGTDPVNVIDSVWAGAMSDDTGILVEETSGTHNNALKITGNPMLFNDGPNTTPTTQYTRVTSALTNILDVVPVTYKAANINLFKDFGLKIGDKCQVTDSLGTHIFYIFSKYITPSGVTFKCTGNTDRDKYISPYENITGVSTTTSSLKVETDRLRGEVSNLEGDVSAIEISLDSIDLSVTNSGTTSQIKLSKDGTVIASPTVTMTGKVNNSDLTSGDIEVVIGGNGGDGSLLIKDSTDTTRVNLDAGSNTYTLGGWTINSTDISRTKTRSGITYTNKLDGLGMEFDLTHDSTDTQADVEGRQVTYSDYPTYANDAAIEINTPILYINHHAQNGTGTTNLNDAKIFLNGVEFTGGSGGEPAAYLKSASVSGQQLTLTNKNDSTVTYNPFPYEIVEGYVVVDADTEWTLNPDYVAGKTHKYDASVTTRIVCSDLTQNVVIRPYECIVTPSDVRLAAYYKAFTSGLTHGRTWTDTHYKTTVYVDKIPEGDDSITFHFFAFRKLN